jgi:hypothetical protein
MAFEARFIRLEIRGAPRRRRALDRRRREARGRGGEEQGDREGERSRPGDPAARVHR